MSTSLKSVVESGMSAVESGAHTLSDTLSDLVDEARSRIEDLPPLAGPRRRRTRKKWGMIAVLAVVAVLLLAMANKRRQEAADPVDQTSVRRR
ncbi:MAG: hypothetical protein ABI949_01535 [Ilumatobacteraceae bacterium]